MENKRRPEENQNGNYPWRMCECRSAAVQYSRFYCSVERNTYQKALQVDHYSRYKYVHLQSTITSQDTLAAKRAFEVHCRNHGVTVKQYHADSGRFADNTFINDCKSQGQTITYCGVNAHWQNGLAEKGIRNLREAARTMLLHAIHRWPSAVTIHL